MLQLTALTATRSQLFGMAAFAFLSLASLTGCSDDDGEGSAPTITDVTVSPTKIKAGETATLDGSLAFEDPDGDVNSLGLALKLGSQTQENPRKTVDTDGQKSGSIAVQLQITVPSAGSLTLIVTAYDAAGHASKPFEVPITVE